MTRRLVLAAAVMALALPLMSCVDNSRPDDGRPHAAEPELDAGLRSLAAGQVDLTIDPGQVRDLDPLNMALNLGVTPPACADFVMAFTWQIRLPEPPGDARVHFLGERMGGSFEVGRPGASGEASIGCALLEAVNEGSVPVVVEMRFVVATSRR